MSFLFGTKLFAQNSPYISGTEFTFTHLDIISQRLFTKNDSLLDFEQTELIISGTNEACIQLSIPGIPYDTSFTLSQNTSRILLPSFPPYPIDSIAAAAILLHSNTPVSVYLGANTFRNNPFIKKNVYSEVLSPNSFSANSYFFTVGAGSWSSSLGVYAPTLTRLLSHEDDNRVYLILGQGLRTDVDLFPPIFKGLKGDTVLFVLDKGESVSFSLEPVQSLNEQVNHSYAHSEKRFSLFLFNAEYKSNVSPTNDGWATEATKGPSHAGKRYFAAPLDHFMGNQYHFLAIQDSTILSFNGSNTVRLDSLDRLDTCITGELLVASNNNFFASLSACSYEISNFPPSYSSGNFLVHLSHTEELIQQSLFGTMGNWGTAQKYIIQVICPTNGIGTMQLDSSLVSPSLFTPFSANSNWSWANLEISNGTHFLESDSGFFGFQYVYGDTLGATPTHAFVLSGNITWPQDSLVPFGGTQPNSLSPWDNLSVAICPGDSLYFQAPPFRHTTWQWDLGDGQSLKQVSNEHPASLLSYSWDQPGTYWLVLSDSLGCSLSDSLLITVQGQPDAQFNSQVITSCAGATVALLALDAAADSYQWSWPGGGASGPSASFQYSGESDSIMVSLVVTAQDCADSTTQFITIPPSKELPKDLPNVITPNGDLQNDVFSFNELDSFEGCYSLRVFNRWGALVHEGTDVFSPFDGNDINGRELSEGVYYYQLELGQTRFQGEIHLFR